MMVSHYTVRERIRILERTSNHEEQIYKVLDMYMDLFPVLDSYLLRYSPIGFLGEGIIAITSSELVHIREERDDVRSLPIIYSAIRERKAKFSSGLEYFKHTNSKYIFPSTISSLLVVPICFGTIVIGYICSSKFEKQSAIDDNLLSSLTLYGKLVGRIFGSNSSTEYSKPLSKRETEVIRRIASGDSTKEMAVLMEISEETVKQYVKVAIKKLGVHNRSQAVAELFRKGIIT